MKKVFALSINWCINGEYGAQIRVFTDLSNAQKALQADFNELAVEHSKWVRDFGLNNASIYEDKYYNDNHCDYHIEECTIE